MIEIIDVTFGQLSKEKLNELFTLRKRIFKDRLDWDVACTGNMEFDEYDNTDATYLLGVYKNEIICSMRFISMQNNNMITGTFKNCFKQINLPKGKNLDASRLFIDKVKYREHKLNQYPLSLILFLSMINYARRFNYEGIYTIVNDAMLIIYKRSGWKVKVLEQGKSASDETIYLLFMPVDKLNQNKLTHQISKRKNLTCDIHNWPLSFSLRSIRLDKTELNT